MAFESGFHFPPIPRQPTNAEEARAQRVFQIGETFLAVGPFGVTGFTIEGVGEGDTIFAEEVKSGWDDPDTPHVSKVAVRGADNGFSLRDLPFSVEPEITYFDPESADPNLVCVVDLKNLSLEGHNTLKNDPKQGMALFHDWVTPDGEHIEFNVFEEDEERLFLRIEQTQSEAHQAEGSKKGNEQGRYIRWASEDSPVDPIGDDDPFDEFY
ncbi:MAG: hypothetical protein HYV40_01830 [Candidatus Levybacteria bacterium]|nr:hypothetical protein [Candidatus Levybacteria bacterium]